VAAEQKAASDQAEVERVAAEQQNECAGFAAEIPQLAVDSELRDETPGTPELPVSVVPIRSIQ
jgi:hypothetical protein